MAPLGADADAALLDLPRLVMHAWYQARRLPPQIADDRMNDLNEDLWRIIKRELARISLDARSEMFAAAQERAKAYIHKERRRDAERRIRDYRRHWADTDEIVAGVAPADLPGGLCPWGWFVYLLWPARDAPQPLYVGRTGNPFSRPGEHLRRADAGEVRWVTLLRCTSQKIMERTEEALIRRYQPPWNTVGVRYPIGGDA